MAEPRLSSTSPGGKYDSAVQRVELPHFSEVESRSVLQLPEEFGGALATTRAVREVVPRVSYDGEPRSNISRVGNCRNAAETKSPKEITEPLS